MTFGLGTNFSPYGADVNSILGNSTEGLTSTAMQQGETGPLLSILVVSVPPMAAKFFQGTISV